MGSSSLPFWPKSATDSEGVSVLSPGVAFGHTLVGCVWHFSQAVGGCWKLHDGHRHTLFSTKSFRAELV